MYLEPNKIEIRGLNLYIRPTYSVLMPKWKTKNLIKTDAQKDNEINLIENKPQGILSKKSMRQLINSVNWLVAAAKEKWVYDKDTKSRYKFKVNFVTLTLPSFTQGISDNKFKSVLLHNFINQMRYRYGLKNFVWKVEAQKNGNIHAHFTTDTYLPWQGIREVWNRILLKNGLMEEYTEKHSSMSFNKYCKTYNPKNKIARKKMLKRYRKGVSSGWSDPNSTDVRSVYKIDDIAAYLAKYMAKDQEERRKISGRLWSCSYSISQANKLTVNIPNEYTYELLQQLNNSMLEKKSISVIDKKTQEEFHIGSMFFYKINDLRSKGNKILSDIISMALFKIREGLCMDFEQVVKKSFEITTYTKSQRESFEKSIIYENQYRKTLFN